jgi:hypothetical protein
MPVVWTGSEQSNTHAVYMPSLLSATFIGQISELLLGSGPRDRRFKSSRPDQFLKKTSRTQSGGPLGFTRVVRSSNRALL